MNWIRKIIGNTWIQHAAFWSLSMYFIGSYFSISNLFKFIDFVYAAFFHIPLLVIVYYNIRYLVPRFLRRENYFPYFLLSFFCIAFAYFVHGFVFDVVIPILPGEFYIVSFTDPQVLITIFVIYLVLSTLLKLSKSWYKLQQLEKDKLALELNALKMQINPHFLFNSLNSLYSLTLKKSDKAPRIVLGLSDLMRYMLYEAGDDEKELTKEVEAITHYIELQKLRSPEAKIEFKIDGKLTGKMVPPLLFFPLIENAFKHGLKSNPGYVIINLKVGFDTIVFNIENDVSESEDLEKGKYGGIGLENVKQRLNLIYGNKAHMIVNDEENQFNVSVNIQL
jgi:sensor histidine kinase YesM